MNNPHDETIEETNEGLYDEGMGTLHARCRIENYTDQAKAVDIEIVADTNVERTWIPSATLEKIGIVKEKKSVQLRKANGETVTRSIGFAILRVDGNFTIDEVVFAEPGDPSVLGARTIDCLNLPPDFAYNNVATLPKHLHKYYAFNQWTQNIFERREIYFQSPDGFNDPLDSKVPTTYEGTEVQRVQRLVGVWQEDRRRRGLPEEEEQALRHGHGTLSSVVKISLSS